MKVTRKEKRLLNQEFNALQDVLYIIEHRFPDLYKLIDNISDPRNKSYIKYDQKVIILERILANCCHLQSMRDMNVRFNNDNVIQNIAIILNISLDELPHGDTINNYLKGVDISQLRDIITYMVKTLIKSKLLYDYRINNEYYHIIIDGVQLNSYSIEHTKGSLCKHHKNNTVTYHNDVLFAMMYFGNIALPVDFEWIENTGTEYNKQDCEINAAKRLLSRIKKTYKRSKICISGDGLYLSEPIIKICETNKWKYIITYKEGVVKTIDDYYKTAKSHDDVIEINNDDGKYEYYNDIEYRDYRINVARLEEKEDRENSKQKLFMYATNFQITKDNYKKMVWSGRNRWKIENKEFNDLKNHGYHITHAFSYDRNAMKAHFAITLIAHVIMQLVEHLEKQSKQFETIRELAEKIKEALRNIVLSAQNIAGLSNRTQIRNEIPY